MNKLMDECLGIAKNMSPIDTGNLAFNALIARPTATGFQLVYQFRIADYMHYLNEGTIYSSIHEGFADRVRNQVAAYINMEMNGQRDALAAAKGRLAQYPDTERRQRTMMASIARNVGE